MITTEQIEILYIFIIDQNKLSSFYIIIYVISKY